ncbi:MAG TPA: NADH-quinone oxidoreductase subunit C [Bellilinea sp.]|nr:NADH-quinone oxidoreductase subunit C [Bellilinea sp.]
MNEKFTQIVQSMQEKFGATSHEYAGDVALIIGPEHIPAAIQSLRDDHGFNYFIDATATDYWPAQEPRFNVIYHLRSTKEHDLIRVRVPLNGNSPHLNTITGVYGGANWKEREIWDLMGIVFDGHPDLRRVEMPEEWVGHPLRKDYPLGYEEVQFTFNFDDIQRTKKYAKE